jgi:hypothetical protein
MQFKNNIPPLSGAPKEFSFIFAGIWGRAQRRKMSPPPILIDGAGESQRAVVCTGNFAGEERWMQTNYVDSHVY